MGDSVNQTCLWRGVLICFLSMALAKPARASGYPSGGVIVAGAAAVVAAVVVVAVVIVHKKSRKKTITGCVNSGANGLSLVDERDKRTYTLSGNTVDIKPGDRVTLQGKEAKPKDKNGILNWETSKKAKDLGACPI
jgi:hypothetical protein